jgi:hypothetical protein
MELIGDSSVHGESHRAISAAILRSPPGWKAPLLPGRGVAITVGALQPESIPPWSNTVGQQ